MTHIHSYTSRLTWKGSTGGGYDSYDRTNRVATPPAVGELVMSSDPAFRGTRACTVNAEIVIEPVIEHARA